MSQDIHTCHVDCQRPACVAVREAVAAQREKVAAWMMQRGYATGHGDTIDDLLSELDWQIIDGWNRVLMNGVKTEREQCAKVCEGQDDGNWFPKNEVAIKCAAAIRARGQND